MCQRTVGHVENAAVRTRAKFGRTAARFKTLDWANDRAIYSCFGMQESAKMWVSRRSRPEAEWLIPRPKRGTKHGEIRRRAREACYMIYLHTDSHPDTCATGSPERTRRTS